MTSAKLPASVLISLGLHGGALVFFGLMLREGPKQAPRIVEGVDLLIQAPKPREGSLVKPPPLSTMDFLKLALPATPRAAAPAQLAIKIPEHKIALADAPKLEDRAHKDLPKLQALDMGAHPVDAARLDVKIHDRRQAAATLAALPRLEDVGRARVKNLPQALALEDQRREAVAAQGLPQMTIKPTTRRQAAAAVAALQEASRGSRERPMFVSAPAPGEIDIRPQHYQRLTEKIAGKPEERILSYLMLRSLKQARYAAQPLGHFALAFTEYAHFTSPIRRYPDLIVHRVLKWALEHPQDNAASGQKNGLYSDAELEAMASETSEAERRSVAAERELRDWKTAQFMESRLGDEFEALIISVQKFGFFVELMEVFVEGLVPINRLEEQTGERCFYRDKDRTIVAQRRRGGGTIEWHLGDRIRVIAERIDPLRRRVEFALAK